MVPVEVWAPACRACGQQWGRGSGDGEVGQWVVMKASSPQSIRRRKPIRAARFFQILETQVHMHRSAITTPIHENKKTCSPRLSHQSFRLPGRFHTLLSYQPLPWAQGHRRGVPSGLNTTRGQPDPGHDKWFLWMNVDGTSMLLC